MIRRWTTDAGYGFLDYPAAEGSIEHLGYLHVEGDEQRRASTCEQCLSYLKVLATLGPLAPLDLLVADIETLPLDLVALERGYITL